MDSRFGPTRVNTIRIPGRDYAQAGAYFVTTCAHRRQPLFGYIENKRMVLNELGRCVEDAWLALPQRFPHVDLDVHVVMPDHMHGIITLTSIPPSDPIADIASVGAGSPRPAPTPNAHGRLPVVGYPEPNANPYAETLGKVIAYFKYAATRSINATRVQQGGTPVFQRGYHEHIIRDDSEWNRISLYIRQNPEKWGIHANPTRLQFATSR